MFQVLKSTIQRIIRVLDIAQISSVSILLICQFIPQVGDGGSLIGQLLLKTVLLEGGPPPLVQEVVLQGLDLLLQGSDGAGGLKVLFPVNLLTLC